MEQVEIVESGDQVEVGGRGAQVQTIEGSDQVKDGDQGVQVQTIESSDQVEVGHEGVHVEAVESAGVEVVDKGVEVDSGVVVKERRTYMTKG
ncbi:hypothetical protein VNO77_41478 [Canavalia gladiata]|uniref:Uncharacterized protein n=1 Tax=Canavalia gladiata TaxID=3824 RepID=A0AAN9JZ46_CANGL